MSLIIFELKTIPDVEGGRRLFDLEGLSDKEVTSVMFHKRRQETGSDFLSLHLHRIVSISLVIKTADEFAVMSLGTEESGEAEIIQQFFSVIEKYTPTLISWNGKGFAFPVLHYRSLVHGIQAAKYWSKDDNALSGKIHNSLQCTQYRHTDLADVLAGDETCDNVPLREMATLLGFPGKKTIAANKNWDLFRSGDLKVIRDNCEMDVLNTYLVYLRFEMINGNLSGKKYKDECELLKSHLVEQDKPHYSEFLAAWKN